MKTLIKTVSLFIIFSIFYLSDGLAQPANDLCLNAEDISDGLWHYGTSELSTLTCTDIRLGNCNTPQQTTNKCCGSSGIEGTVWYKFTSANVGASFLEFRYTSCNPFDFFGTITTLQGFIMKKNICADNSLDIITECFNPNTAADFSTPFTSEATQEYYVQVDTKRNTWTSCSTCGPTSATCHSYCTFEVRVALPIPTPIKLFDAKAESNHVTVEWLYDWSNLYTHFQLVRNSVTANDTVIIASKSIKDFLDVDGYFSFNDYSVKNNGYYKYNLYAGHNSNGPFAWVGGETIYIDFATETYMNMAPNPSRTSINLILTNTEGKEYQYTITNTMGQLVKSGNTIGLENSETPIDIASLADGIYFSTVILEDKVLQSSFVKE